MKTRNFKYSDEGITHVEVTNICAVNNYEAIKYAKAALKKYGRLITKSVNVDQSQGYGNWVVTLSS